MQIDLPWPQSKLGPNARTHWAQKARIAKQYRRACALETRAASSEDALRVFRQQTAKGSIAMFIDFFPPDRRHRDDDNLVAAFKSGRDGIADALGVDDRLFRILPFLREETAKGGLVRVRITLAP